MVAAFSYPNSLEISFATVAMKIVFFLLSWGTVLLGRLLARRLHLALPPMLRHGRSSPEEMMPVKPRFSCQNV